jgi:hypothetical protein
MDDIDILEIKDLLNQQTKEFSTELEAFKQRLPKPPPRWWETAFEIATTGLAVGLSFIGGVMFHRYLFYIPCN